MAIMTSLQGATSVAWAPPSHHQNTRKTKFTKNNRLFLAIATTVILTLSYFLIPTIFSKDLMMSLIKNEILKKYNIDIKFNEKLKYGLLPRPHFVSENISIIKDKNISIIKEKISIKKH